MQSHRQIAALALIGAGLLVLGALAFAFLPKLGADKQDVEADYQSAIPFPVDFPAPELNLTDLDGNAVSLNDYLGQVVLINNWAFWCPPCRAEMPVLQSYYKDHKDQGFTVVAIEAGGELEDVEYHANLYKLTFPVWQDPTEESLRAFGISSLPNSYLVDANGQVRLAWNGPISREMLEEHVTPFLKD